MAPQSLASRLNSVLEIGWDGSHRSQATCSRSATSLSAAAPTSPQRAESRTLPASTEFTFLRLGSVVGGGEECLASVCGEGEDGREEVAVFVLVSVVGSCAGRGEGTGDVVGELGGASGVHVALGGLNAGVAEDGLDSDWVEPADEQGGGGVAQGVEGEWRCAGAVAGFVVAAAQRGGVGSVAGGRGEDVVVGAGEVGTAGESSERLDRLVGEGYRADLPGLGGELDGGREGAFDGEYALCEVDVAPAQHDQFAEP